MSQCIETHDMKPVEGTPSIRECTRCGQRDEAPFEGDAGQLRANFDRESQDVIEEADRDADMVDASGYRGSRRCNGDARSSRASNRDKRHLRQGVNGAYIETETVILTLRVGGGPCCPLPRRKPRIRPSPINGCSVRLVMARFLLVHMLCRIDPSIPVSDSRQGKHVLSQK
jgi:hypothetical protein